MVIDDGQHCAMLFVYLSKTFDSILSHQTYLALGLKQEHCCIPKLVNETIYLKPDIKSECVDASGCYMKPFVSHSMQMIQSYIVMVRL